MPRDASPANIEWSDHIITGSVPRMQPLALTHAGLPDNVVLPGGVAVDKDARLELVRTGP